ncbi:MAG: hypothetical protein BZY77_04175 [SAR202 cluster bacterium Io17-Chloro-G5]|nr:MAG: hypothetical protein BZY77_04175 [SAR202 cluster bacterium Io17-Chloro-G5]
MAAPSIATDQNLRGLSLNNDKTPDGASAAPSILQINSPSEFSRYTFLVQVVTQISIPGQRVVDGRSPIWADLNGDGH